MVRLALSLALCSYMATATDWHYYLNANAAWNTSFTGGHEMGWNGEHDGDYDIELFYPAVVKVSLEQGSSWPSSGKAFWTHSDVTWVVASGTATFGVNASQPHVYGDVFWASAGTEYGPIVNTGSTALVVLGVSGGGRRALVPQSLPAPAANPSTGGPQARVMFPPSPSPVTTNRSYRNVTSSYMPNPSPHTQECTNNGGVWNKMWPQEDMSPPVLRVKFAVNCSIPWHYHPTGALYFISHGTMAFEGDKDGDSTKFNVGDVRWVRPGWTYGPEHNVGDGWMEITVMGTDSPPAFLDRSKKAPEPYHVRKQVYVNHVYDAHTYEI